MVDLSGRYQLEKDENAEQYLREMGLSEEGITAITQRGSIFELVQESDTMYVTKISTGLTLVFADIDKEFEEPLFKGVKSTCKREGNTFTMTSKLSDGRISTRIYKFTEEDLEVDMKISDVIARRYFKKM